MYKNQLQELAQRSCFNLPSYSCIREGPDHAPRFKAAVNFNGETFESPSFCSTLRQAEHAAAEVALNTLASRGPSRALAARILDETGVYKNLLQETAHRAGLQLPVYTTVRSGPGHVPVFSCTVELGGMGFTGERARTKKQAQKNAAMAAWFALKRLVQHGSLSSSLSTSSIDTKRVGEEQEQVTIARVLASLLPSELKNTKENDFQLGHDRFIPFYEDLTSSTPSLYPMQCQSWAYPGFSPEMALYQMWQQEQLFHLQNHLFTLQLPPGSPPGPQILPYVQSIVPDSRLFGPMMEQECVPMGPRITVATSMPSLYLSDRVVSDPISGKSRVTIQEIHEEKHEEPEISMTVVSETPTVGNFNIEPRLKEPIHDDGKQKEGELRSKVESLPVGENQTHQFEWASCRSMDSGFKPADFGAQNPHGYGSCQHPPRPPSPRTNRPTPSIATPVLMRTVGSVPSSSAAPSPLNRNMGYVPPMQQPSYALAPIPAPPRMRTGGPSYSGRPLPQRMNFGVMNPRFMAPPVRIRSVVPVCSAPPPRKVPTSIQEGHLANSRNNHAVSENVTEAGSELGKLQL